MRTVRLPESFFDTALVERLRVLVSQLTPFAKNVIVCHLDAPGWCLLDLGVEKQPGAGKTTDLLTSSEPIIVDTVPRFRDEVHGISGRLEGDSVFWEWTPVEGLSVYGRLDDADAWNGLVSRVCRISHPLKSLFAPNV